MDFQPMSIGFEPAPDVFVLVVGGIVLNQHCAVPTITAAELFQESSVRGRVEYGVLCVVKAGIPQIDSSKDFHIFAFASNWDFRRATNSTPCRMESGILTETGFVGKDQRPVLRVRFFLMPGYVYRCQRSRSAASALANTRFGRCTEKPI